MPPTPHRLCLNCGQSLGWMRAGAQWCRERECQLAKKRALWHANKDRYTRAKKQPFAKKISNSRKKVCCEFRDLGCF